MTTKVLYPALDSLEPTAPVDLDTQPFRLQEIRTIRTELESDLQTYNRCRRRYSSAYSGINYVTNGLSFLNVVEASASVGFLASGFGLPVSIGLSTCAGVSSVLTIFTNFIAKKICVKLEKHDQISALVMAKLTSIKLIVSKALEDSQISEREFVLVQRDFEEYKKLKREIQLKNRDTKTIDVEQIKKKLIEQGKKIGRKEQMQKLQNTLSE